MEEAAVLALESCQRDNFFNFEGAIKFGSHRLLPAADAPDIPGRKSCPQCRKHLVELRQVSLTHTVSPPGVILWCPLCRLHRCLTRRGNGSNASVCLHLFCPDASDIDRSINVNVLPVVCCFSCLLIKIMQNERKAIFFLGKKMKYNEIQSTVIECSLLECDGAVCHPPDVRIPTVTGEKFETLYFDILYTQCLDILSPNNVLREDLPKSVCSVKKMKPSVLFVCTDTFQLTANIFFGPTGVGVFCGVFFFPLKNEIEGRNFNLQTP